MELFVVLPVMSFYLTKTNIYFLRIYAGLIHAS